MASIFPGRRTAISIPSERPQGSGPPCLVIISGDDMGRRYELGHTEVTIGRTDECTICVATDQVSRKHAAVQGILGKYFIVDLRSTNGTFVNEQKVERAKLVDGDQIRVGKTVLKYTESRVEQRYFEHAFNLASIDALTGAFNKRYFDESFGKDVQRAQQTGTPLSMVLFDIDHFKKINDVHGHLAGDYVLKELARVVQGRIRRDEVFARYGGEEFAIILPETDLLGASALADSIREKIQEHHFVFQNDQIRVTISVGVATLEEADKTSTDLIKRADERLFEAKRAGRNRVC
jgi:two-component system cell cycle response regulator